MAGAVAEPTRPPQNTYERGRRPPPDWTTTRSDAESTDAALTHPAEATPGSPRVFGWRWELRRRSTPRADAPCGASARKPPTSRPPFLAAKPLVAAGRKPAPRGKREPRRPPDQPLRLPDWNDLDSPGAHLRRSWLVAKSARAEPTSATSAPLVHSPFDSGAAAFLKSTTEPSRN